MLIFPLLTQILQLFQVLHIQPLFSCPTIFSFSRKSYSIDSKICILLHHIEVKSLVWILSSSDMKYLTRDQIIDVDVYISLWVNVCGN